MNDKTARKLDPSFWLSLFFVAVIAVWVVTAARFDRDTRLFPWAIGIPALALALRQLVTDWYGSESHAEEGEQARYAAVLDIPVDHTISPEVMTRHTLKTAAWILAFAGGIWLVGFLISIPLFIFLYLLYQARAGKLGALIIAGLTFAFVWAVFDAMMHLAWPEGALFIWLGY